MLQLKIMLHALGFFRPGEKEIDIATPQANIYTQEAVDAVDKFRAAQGWQTTVPGFVDARTIERLWKQLEETGAPTRFAVACWSCSACAEPCRCARYGWSRTARRCGAPHAAGRRVLLSPAAAGRDL